MDWIAAWALAVVTLLPGPSPDPAYWRTIIERLDTVRADAFDAGDADQLTGVYGPGAGALATDTTTIHAYQQRGLQLSRVTMEIISVRVAAYAPKRAQLDVVDRLGRVRVRSSDGSWRSLPADRPTRRTLTLRLTDVGWRITSVRSQ